MTIFLSISVKMLQNSRIASVAICLTLFDINDKFFLAISVKMLQFNKQASFSCNLLILLRNIPVCVSIC